MEGHHDVAAKRKRMDKTRSTFDGRCLVAFEAEGLTGRSSAASAMREGGGMAVGEIKALSEYNAD